MESPPIPAEPPLMADSLPRMSHGVPLREAVGVWMRIGLESFGGPAGQIAVMHRVLVEQKRWISEARFLHALNYCMLLPGPEAMQLATYVGWLMHRTLGGLIAGVLFVLPGFVSILVLSLLYAGYHDLALVSGLFFGLKPAVLAVVIQAMIRIGRRALRHTAMYAIAASSFIAIHAFNAPFPWIIAAAAVIGALGGRVVPRVFHPAPSDPARATSQDAPFLRDGDPGHGRPSLARSAIVLLIWLPLWLAPVAALFVTRGGDDLYFKQSAFFSIASMVTFGGAYSVLAYVAQQAVEVYQWLLPGEMLDGLGMAETTPGPLIQVVQFVGFMGAYRQPGALNPFVAGTLASVLVTWVTFVPCFLWIFLGAPYIEALRGNRLLTSALTAVTAAVVGVVLHLAVWFSMHTLFTRTHDITRWGLDLTIPEVGSIDIAAAGIALVAALLLFRLRVGMLPTLFICAALGVVYRLVLGQ